MSTSEAARVVRVASGQGFWGDWLEAPRRQVEGGAVDYLMLDYLAEVTMSILQKQKSRDPRMGYARDFIGAMESVFPAVAPRGVKVIANAGGVNPTACADAVLEAADRHGVAVRLEHRRGAALGVRRPGDLACDEIVVGSVVDVIVVDSEVRCEHGTFLWWEGFDGRGARGPL